MVRELSHLGVRPGVKNNPPLLYCTKMVKCHRLLRRQHLQSQTQQIREAYNRMNKKIKTEAVDQLFGAILKLQNKEECYQFFEDLCTVNELLSLSQRLEVAAMLQGGKTYLEIAEKTGASTATISRVNRCLNYGNDGYTMAFERMLRDGENVLGICDEENKVEEK